MGYLSSRSRGLSLIVLTISAVLAANAVYATVDDKQAILQALQQLREGYEKKNLDQFSHLLSDTSFPKKKEYLAAIIEEWKDATFTVNELGAKVLGVEIDGDSATVRAEFTVIATTVGTGEQIGPVTFALECSLRRELQDWKFTSLDAVVTEPKFE